MNAGWEKLGHMIRERRKATGRSMRALARELQVSHTFLQGIESGHKRPSLGTLQNIIAVIGGGDELIGEYMRQLIDDDLGVTIYPAWLSPDSRQALTNIMLVHKRNTRET